MGYLWKNRPRDPFIILLHEWFIAPLCCAHHFFTGKGKKRRSENWSDLEIEMLLDEILVASSIIFQKGRESTLHRKVVLQVSFLFVLILGIPLIIIRQIVKFLKTFFLSKTSENLKLSFIKIESEKGFPLYVCVYLLLACAPQHACGRKGLSKL